MPFVIAIWIRSFESLLVEARIRSFFTGVQSTKLSLHIEGAPNFRSVPSQHVFGSAMPTLEGMERVLRHVGCGPSPDGSGQARANKFGDSLLRLQTECLRFAVHAGMVV